MKTTTEIEKEIKRLKAQVKQLQKDSKKSGFASGVTIAFRIVALQHNLHALAWVLDQENKTKLGFNLKTTKNEKISTK